VDLWDFLILLTMQKLTKRKGFNFFRSYYDVYNELETPEDKVAFIDALLDRQFLGVKPTDLKGMAKFAYISQVNSIDSQVKGYEDKTKTILNPTQPPTQGVTTPPTVQVEVKEKVKEKVKDIKPTAFSFFNSLVSLGANKQLVNDWIAVRKTKKATNTETAFNKFKKEFELSGHTIDEVLEKCVEKSWSGFNADWFKKENVNLQPNGIGRTNQKLMIYKND
jgi:hypothetical protein